jgi:hypothetical protein
LRAPTILANNSFSESRSIFTHTNA